jgi:hypothetical protein
MVFAIFRLGRIALGYGDNLNEAASHQLSKLDKKVIEGRKFK